jgi:hypothetical protein
MGLSDLNMKFNTNLVSKSRIYGAGSPLLDVCLHGFSKDEFMFTLLNTAHYAHFCFHTIRNFKFLQFVSTSEFGTKTILLLFNVGR